MARWQNKGATYLVDREGVVIGPADSERYAGLPLIVGEGAPQAAPALFDTMAGEPDLFQRIEAGVWVSGRRWNLYLDNDVEIFLPEEGIEQAWSRLAELDRRHGLLGKAVSAIDLRLEDRLVLRLAPLPDVDDEAGRRI
jgi:cell division protein FtsQ